MELRMYMRIFKQQKKIFLSAVLICMIGGAVWWLQPKGVISDIVINVTRSGKDATTDYQYHDFYRLQADERFADTVVRWLEMPRFVTDIYQKADISTDGISLEKVFRAERLSSQVISIRYYSADVKSAESIAAALGNVLNTETQQMNSLQQEESWFVLDVKDPVISDAQPALWKTVFISCLVGVFIGLWAVMIGHYVSSRDEEFMHV